jgi:Aldehyde dehydrogenase family
LAVFQNTVDGKKAEAREFFETFDPFAGRPWAKIPRCNAVDVDAAVGAANRAFRANPWRAMNASQRGRLLVRLADLIEAEADRLAAIEVRDNGKLIAEMSAQLRYLPQWYRYFGGLVDKIEGGVLPIDKPGMFAFTRREPLGVIACIVPWNSPLLLLTWKLAPALAAGNTVVIKPSEHASASTLAFVELFEKAGFPPGVVNTLTGFPDQVGAPLAQHPRVAKIAFTGGEAGGAAVYRAAAAGFKHVSLELGGKSPNIIFADAKLENAVNGAVSGIFAATGQTCIAGSRCWCSARSMTRWWIAWSRWPARRGSAIPPGRRRKLGQSPPWLSASGCWIMWISRAAKVRPACSAAASQWTPRSAKAGSSSPRSSPVWPTGCASRGRRSLARSSPSFHSMTRTMHWPLPTTAPMAWQPASGHRISGGPSACRSGSRRARSG